MDTPSKNKLRILAIHSIQGTDYTRHSAIDMWRVFWPLEELKKHVDWIIDYQTSFIPNGDTYTSVEQFDEAELEKVAQHLGSYDIIFSSYQPSPFVFSLLKMIEKRYGTKYVLDDDDDVYNIEPDNPFWLKSKPEDVYYMQRMIELSSHITTTTPTLQRRYQQETAAKVHLAPNFISNAYKNDVVKDPERLTIGYFGGAGHYHDLHETGAIQAIEKIMHEFKHVHFVTVGVPIDHSLPSKRKHEHNATNVHDWVYKVFPRLNIDISIAPLRLTEFSKSKSNIKWQEATRLYSAFLSSNIGPYSELPPHVLTRVDNTPQAWYEALKTLITDTEKRHEQIKNAKKELADNWTLEKNWTVYKELFERVKAS